LTTQLLPWLKKEGFTWPEDKPLTCHSFRCGIESYLMNVCKVDRFYIVRQGSWAITELAGDLLLRYDREQTIASRIICETLNSALNDTFISDEEKNTNVKENEPEKEQIPDKTTIFIQIKSEKKQNDDKMDTLAQDVSEVMKSYMNFMNVFMFSKNKQ
jgi:hypothetical protein